LERVKIEEVITFYRWTIPWIPGLVPFSTKKAFTALLKVQML
jgi:hypothetical protein